MYDPETYYKAIELRNKGYRIKEIAKALGVKYDTLRGWFYHGKKPKGAEKKEVKRYKKSYEPEIYYEIIKLWNQGLKLKEIKERYPDIPLRTLKNWIQGIRKPYKAKKLRIKRKRKLYNYNKKEIIREILQGKSTKEIVKKYHITAEVVYNLKKRHNLVVHHTKNHYDFNTALELNDELKAYLIGLLDDIGINKHVNYYELKLTTTHITYLGLIKKIFKNFPYNLRFAKRMRKYRKQLREIYETEVRIAMPPYDYLVKRRGRRRWIEWAVNNYFINFLAGLMDADGSIMISKKGEYILTITNSKKYLIDIVKNEFIKLGLNPIIRFNKRTKCYQIQIRRKSEVRWLLRQLMLKHPEKVFLKHLILSNKFDVREKHKIYRKYRSHVKQRSQRWIKGEYGLSLLRYYPPLPLLGNLS